MSYLSVFYAFNRKMSPYEFTGIVAEKCGVLVNFTLGMLFSMMAVLYSFFFIKDSRQIRTQRLQAELAEQLHEFRLSKRFEGDVTIYLWASNLRLNFPTQRKIMQRLTGSNKTMMKVRLKKRLRSQPPFL